MTLDPWGLGLQAVNVLILVWLLSRVFWRPVADAIAARQEAANTMIGTAEATRSRAEAALAEVTEMRAGLAAERAALLDAARGEAEEAAKGALAEARRQADATLAAAKETIAQDAETARKDTAVQASELALEVAARLLEQVNEKEVQAAFLARLIDTIAKMPAADRTALAAEPQGIKIVTPSDPGADRHRLETAVAGALGGSPTLRFVTDPALIAGLELRTSHFVLRNSWQADLEQVGKAMKDAA